jgi:thiol-disulfide isomerase/thioredoxin
MLKHKKQPMKNLLVVLISFTLSALTHFQVSNGILSKSSKWFESLETVGYKPGSYNSLMNDIQVSSKVSKPQTTWTDNYFLSGYKMELQQESREQIMKLSQYPIKDTSDWFFLAMDDKKVRMTDYKGKLVLFEFWFVGCPPCIKAIPFLNKLREQYDSDKIAIVSVEYKNEKEIIEEYLAQKNFDIKYQLLYNGQNTAKQLNIKGAPTFILVNKEGRVVFWALGLSEKIKEEIIQNINSRI